MRPNEHDHRHFLAFAGRRWLWLLGGLMFLASCATSAAPRADVFTCHTAYRSGPSVPIEGEDALTLNESHAAEEVTYKDLSFNAEYSSGEGDGERALRLWASDSGSGVVLFSQLYQLPLDSGPQDQFVGGHGFTGLNYAYHPASGAELQYWCTAG